MIRRKPSLIKSPRPLKEAVDLHQGDSISSFLLSQYPLVSLDLPDLHQDSVSIHVSAKISSDFVYSWRTIPSWHGSTIYATTRNDATPQCFYAYVFPLILDVYDTNIT